MKKITRRSFLAAAGVSAAALALTACGGSSNSTAASTATSAAASTAPAGDAAAAASDPKVTLVYAEVNPLDTIVGQTGSHFKEKVEELTGGSVVVDVQASGVLGSENDVLDAILGGSTSIDISRISAFALTSYGCNKSKLQRKKQRCWWCCWKSHRKRSEPEQRRKHRLLRGSCDE